MRLSEKEILLLKQTVKNLSQDAKIFLFGSRIDDKKKGGDIDLLILSDSLGRKEIRKLRVEFFKYFGEQKLDIVLDSLNPKKIFTKIILNEAKEII